jgi:hypothetical protein
VSPYAWVKDDITTAKLTTDHSLVVPRPVCRTQWHHFKLYDVVPPTKGELKNMEDDVRSVLGGVKGEGGRWSRKFNA